MSATAAVEEERQCVACAQVARPEAPGGELKAAAVAVAAVDAVAAAQTTGEPVHSGAHCLRPSLRQRPRLLSPGRSTVAAFRSASAIVTACLGIVKEVTSCPLFR